MRLAVPLGAAICASAALLLAAGVAGAGQCQISPNTNYEGDLVATQVNVSSPEACCAACQSVARCNVFVFCPLDAGCLSGSQDAYPKGFCGLKFQSEVASNGQATAFNGAYGHGSTVPFTSGYTANSGVGPAPAAATTQATGPSSSQPGALYTPPAGTEASAPPQSGTFKLQGLAYPTNGLEPSIDNKTVYLHHVKHMGGAVTELNAAISGSPQLQALTLLDIIKGIGTSVVSGPNATAIENQGGNVFNHLIYFSIMSSPGTGGSGPGPALAAAINQSFGSYSAFKEQFSAAAAKVFGSGWAWLTVSPSGSLAIETTPNQDNPIMAGLGKYSGNVPIMGIDVWEHSYYLKYQNVRADYIKAWYNVINWPKVDANYAFARAGKPLSIIAS